MKIVWIGLERVCGLEDEHEVLIMTKSNWDNKKLLEFNPDIIIEREFNNSKYYFHTEWDFIKKNLPNAKKVIWFIDTHVVKGRQISYCKYVNFDYAFFAISKYVDVFKDYISNSYWLPLSLPINCIPKKQEKIYPIGYVGRFNLPYLKIRTKFLEDIFEVFREKCHFVTDYTNVYKIMGQSKIMLNLSYGDDMNFRTFEALACGCTLLTNEVPDLHKIDGLFEKIKIYKSTDDCIEIIRTLLDKEPVDYSDYIRKNHLLSNRTKKLIKMIKTNKQEAF